MDLKTDIGWIKFTYPDKSVRVVRTTLNPEILGERILARRVRDDQIFDLGRVKWVNLPSSPDVVMEVSEEMPELSEVDKIANRFI